jgi:hypothetical protein
MNRPKILTVCVASIFYIPSCSLHYVWLWPRPYDWHCMAIRKSDDLRNDYAKNLILKVLLAQSVAMQIISTPSLTGRGARQKWIERKTFASLDNEISCHCPAVRLKLMLGARYFLGFSIFRRHSEISSGSFWLACSLSQSKFRSPTPPIQLLLNRMALRSFICSTKSFIPRNPF